MRAAYSGDLSLYFKYQILQGKKATLSPGWFFIMNFEDASVFTSIW